MFDFYRISSQEIPSDISFNVGGMTFSLHKFPLMSKCGYMRKLLSASNGPKDPLAEIPDLPGGSEAFDLAAKFCYGTDIEINTHTVAMLRCAAEYLEMTEDYAVGNLVSRTEAYLEEVVLMSLPAAVIVLQKSEGLLPMAEKVKLVSRCIGAVAYIAWNDDQFSSSVSSSSSSHTKTIVDWWAEELTVLRIDTFQRVLLALKARGFRQEALGPVLMLYAQKSLRGHVSKREE